MVEAWGAIGNALTDAAVGYTTGLLAPDIDEIRTKRAQEFRKGESDLQTAETTRKLNEAHAAYYALGHREGGNAIRAYTDPVTGARFRFNLVTGERLPDFTGGKPEKPPTEDTIYKRSLRHAMEQVIGAPMEQWTPEQQVDPRIKDMRDLYNKRDDWIYTPTGWVRRDDPAFKPPPPPSGTGGSGAGSGTTPAPPERKPPGAAAAEPGPQAREKPAPGTVFLGKTTPEMEDAIAEAHRQFPQVRPELIRAMIASESSYNPYARSGKGAEGLMGLMPGTGREMGVKDPFDVAQNVVGGTRYLAQMLTRYGGSEAMALAAYNAGPGAFEKAGKKVENLSEETRTYVPRVLGRAGPPSATGAGTAAAPPSDKAQAPPSDKAAAPSASQRPRLSEPMVKRYMDFHRDKTPEGLLAERDRLMQEQAADPKPITAHHLEAIDRLLAGTTSRPAAAPTGKPTVPPESVPPPVGTPAAPGKPAGPRVVQTADQQQAQADKAETAARAKRDEYRNQARLEMAIAAANKDKEAGIDNEQNRIANDLFVSGKIDSPSYSENIPEHQKQVNDILAEPKRRKELREEAEAVWARNRDDRAQTMLERQQLIDLTGKVTPEQAAMTNKLYTETDPGKKVGQRHYALLSPEDQEKVNKELRDPKLRKEHLDALKQAQPMLDELAMLENTQYLTRQIIPLLTRANVGLGGKVTNFSNWAFNNLPSYRAAHLLKAEEQMKKEGLGPSLDKALEDARATAMMEGSDPGLLNSMYYTGGRSRLETLVALLMYSHAMAQKRIGAGTARGITTEDMKEARALFDPADFFATPDKMYEKLVTLQQTIQRGKQRKEEEVRSYHIDPKTRNLVLKNYYQEGESPAGEGAVPDQAQERVRSGPRRK
jgi:hypothetical protein